MEQIFRTIGLWLYVHICHRGHAQGQYFSYLQSSDCLCPDPGLRPGPPPRVLPEGDVELYGPDRGLLCNYFLHHGYDVRPET